MEFCNNEVICNRRERIALGLGRPGVVQAIKLKDTWATALQANCNRIQAAEQRPYPSRTAISMAAGSMVVIPSEGFMEPDMKELRRREETLLGMQPNVLGIAHDTIEPSSSAPAAEEE